MLEEQISRVEGLTNENYKRSLQMLLEMDKKMDARQSDLLSELRSDFAKAIASLDNTAVIKELEESFGRKLKTFE